MSTLTKAERKALDELFITMHEKRNFLSKVRSSRKEMLRIFRTLIKNSNTQKSKL